MNNNKNIYEIIYHLQAIDISKYDDSFLAKSFQKRMTDTQCLSIGDYCNYLKKDEKESKILVDSLNINYSVFFRNTLTFAVLERVIFPSILLKKKNNKQKEIRIWSAASAGGQEAYSVAILLEELKSISSDKFDYRIFATDIGKQQISEALTGYYSESSLSFTNLNRINKWFYKQNDSYRIKPELKLNIDFSTFDILDEQYTSPPASIFGHFDLVICANLLFYYKPDFRKIILKKVAGCIAEGGYLVTGETEREILLNFNYREIFPISAIFMVDYQSGNRNEGKYNEF